MSVIRRKLTAAAAAAALAVTVSGSSVPFCADAGKIPEPTVSMALLAGGSAIGMEFLVTIPDGYSASDYTITLDGETPSLQETEDGVVFTAADYAMNMTKTHTVEVQGKNNGVNITKSVSMKEYLDGLTGDEDYGDLAKAMLMYGGAAQSYFGVDTSSLASDLVEGADYSDVTVDAEPFDAGTLSAALMKADAPVRYYGMNLSLKSEITFTLYFSVAEGATQTEAVSYLNGFTFGAQKANAAANAKSYAQVSCSVPASALTRTYTLEQGGISADFSPVQYIASATNGSDAALADVCKALYAYADAVVNFKLPDDPAESPKSDAFAVRKGRATTYNYSVGNAHLDDYVVEHSAYVAALTDEDYEAYAGGMIEVTYNDRSIRAIVADSMRLATNPTRRAGDVDLDPAAFEALTGATTGEFDITWRIVPNSYAEDSNVQYFFEAGKIYYMKMHARNTTYPVAKFEVKIENGSYIELPKTSDNCYVIENPGTAVLSIRMTDIFDQVVEELNYNTGMTETQKNNVTMDGTVQFPK